MVALTDFTLAFEMATTSTPRTASPSYTALTSFVMAADTINLARGRGSEQDRSPQPGRANVTLRNTDGRFTMGNGSSPYAPLQLRRPCRFRVTYAATTYDLWQGFVDTWETGRNELTGRARLELSDRLGRAQALKFSGALDAEILSDSPQGYWPLDDPAGTFQPSDRTGRASSLLALSSSSFVTSGEFTFGIGSAPGPDAKTQLGYTVATMGANAVQFVNQFGFTAGSATATSGHVALFVPSDAASTASGADRAYFNVSEVTFFVAGVSSPNGFAAGNLFLLDNGGGGFRDLGINVLGRSFMLGFTRTISAGTVTLTVYIDGVQVFTTSFAGTQGAGNFSVGGSNNVNAYGRISNAACWGVALSAARFAAYARATTSWQNELTTARFTRICANAGVPSSGYGVVGNSGMQMGPQPLANVTLLQALTDIAKAEGGVAYCDATGALELATASNRYGKTVGLTLDASKAGQVLSDTTPRTDLDTLVNEATGTRNGGNPQVAADATSQTNYDTHDDGETLYVAQDYNALNWAQWQVASYKDPRPRLESVTVDVVAYANSGGNVANLFNADVGTKIQVTNLPSDTSATSTLTLFVEGVRHSIGKQQWLITFTTSPVALEDSVWVLDSNLLGTNTILGY